MQPVIHAKVGQKFSSQAGDYEKGRDAYGPQVFDQIVKEVGTTKLEEVRALDLGCGTGISTRALYEKGFIAVKGLDIDSGMLEKAKNNKAKTVPEQHYFQGNVADVRAIFKDEQFDLITAFSAFHWFCTAEAVNELKSVLKPGGIFVIASGGGDVDQNKRAGGSQAKFWKLIESIKGSPVHNPRENYEPVTVLEQCGFEVKSYIFETPSSQDFERAVAKRRSFSGWCNMTDEQKAKGEPLLQEFVRQQIAEQNHPDGKLHTTKKESCLVARLKELN